MNHCKNFKKALTCPDLFDAYICSYKHCRNCPAEGGDLIRKYIGQHLECRVCSNRSEDFAVIHNLRGNEGIMCSNMDLED